MALGATLFRVELMLSDVDRGVYATLDVRLAQHPSETMRYLLTRLFAYCLAYEEGIVFSKGGLSSTDEPPLSVRRPSGELAVWIEVGVPSAERLHKASKAAPQVKVFTSADIAHVRREAARRHVHAPERIEIHRLEGAFLDEIAPKIAKSTKMELTVSGGHLYARIADVPFETPIERAALREET